MGVFFCLSLRKGAAYFRVPVRIAPWAMVEEIDGQIKAKKTFYFIFLFFAFWSAAYYHDA
jgi:hypothetical protein